MATWVQSRLPATGAAVTAEKRCVTLDSAHIDALVANRSFSQLFPGMVVNRQASQSCCGQAVEYFRDVKQRLLGMSGEQARRVAAAIGIQPNTRMTVRVVYKNRVDTRSFDV